MDLTELRKEIDSIDVNLVQLFCQRMEVAAKIADYKKENNLPVYHPAREEAVLQKVADLAGSDLADYTRDLYRELFALSRRYQTERF